jgi:hypothetical protein
VARGTGKTREQMLKAANGSIFIWCNHHIDYPKYLAQAIGRKDLKIVAPSWLDNGWQGRELSGIVVDHAAELNAAERDNLTLAVTRIRAAFNTSDAKE